MTDQPKNTMEAFFTREKANAGIQVPLHLPTGERSEHWVEIYGVDSDAFRTADAMSRREGVRIAQIEDHAARDLATAELTRRLRASLVKSWSFPQECTPENVVAFLKEAPQIGEAIDRVSSNRTLFFGIASQGSSRSPSTNSSSTSSPKAAASRGARASSKSPSKADGLPES